MERFVVPSDARTWVEGAQETDFPIQNIPFGTAVLPDRGETLVAAIGDWAVDCQALLEGGLLDEEEFPSLYGFYELAEGALPRLRRALFDLLVDSNPALRDSRKLRKAALVPLQKAEMQVPIPPNDFVDFYSGIHHAENAGRMFKPESEPLLPNYRQVPVGFHCRTGSVAASGTPIVRPKGQIRTEGGLEFAPTKELDFELELGFYVGEGQEMGRRIPCTQAEDHILGLVLLNDWSARDFQRWESRPLGPLQSKSFATTVSPWIVLLDALEPFRIEGMEQEPVLPYLRRHGLQHFDIQLEACLKTAKMKEPQAVSRTSARHLYWSMAQQLAHLTSNGAPAAFGDLCGTGAISAPDQKGYGTLLELSWRGTKPLVLSSGETRTYLEDGDEVILRGRAQGEGFRIGFGEAKGKVARANT